MKGVKTIQKIYFKTAISRLVDENPYKTRCIQAIIVNIPMGEGQKKN